MRMDHGGPRLEHLDPTRLEHGPAEGLVLGVVELGEAQLLPAGAQVAGVHVREEGEVPLAVHHRAPVRRKAREELGQLPSDHRARAGVGQMRSERGAHARVERERLAVGGEPAGLRDGVLREEADQLPGRALCAQVAGAPVAELARRDLDHLVGELARDLQRAVARARVDHQQLELPLGAHGLQRAAQQRRRRP